MSCSLNEKCSVYLLSSRRFLIKIDSLSVVEESKLYFPV